MDLWVKNVSSTRAWSSQVWGMMSASTASWSITVLSAVAAVL